MSAGGRIRGGKAEIRKELVEICKIDNFQNSRKTAQVTSIISTQKIVLLMNLLQNTVFLQRPCKNVFI